MFDYLRWRGDITFSQVPVNRVDMLIFATLAYIRFEDIVPNTADAEVTLKSAAKAITQLTDKKDRCRVPADLELLAAAAESERFKNVKLTSYKSIFIPQEDTQFSAVTFLPDKKTICPAFRGTDNTLVGWKEDFNMTFQDSVPAQRLAKEYVQETVANKSSNLLLCGHSKGGNLAVYAASKCGAELQKRILHIFNFDGPGFTEHLLNDSGYKNIIPKIHTFVPQSSVFGMLLQREEAYAIIKSNNISFFQHDPYSWEIAAADFIPEDALTADARFFDRTFHNWISGMTVAERNEFFDSLFELLMTENAQKPIDILKPHNIKTYFKSLKADENMRRIIAAEFLSLAQSAKNAQKSSTDTEQF